MESEIKRRIKKAYWFPIAFLAIPVDWFMWNCMCWGWLTPYEGYKTITFKEAWNDSWEAWRNL